MVGQTIGSYTVKSPIGSGGMGTVFLGIDNALERPVAIKVLSDTVTQDPVVLQRFRAEAVTLARLSHPNIANIYNFIHLDDKYMLIMEYVEGETLEQLLRRLGPLKPGEAAYLVGQGLMGLAHAHAKGIVHRDVKPANLMLTKEGVVKLTDFGIARVQGSTKMTSAGKIVGTPEYMSPEQIQWGEVDARSDIYSMGIVLYELLTGAAPFSSTSEYEVMRNHVEKPPRSLKEVNSKIPAGLDKVVQKSLAKKPEDRYQTAMDFRTALAPFVTAQAPSAPSHTLAEGVPAYTPPPSKSGPRTPAKGVSVPKSPSSSKAGLYAALAVVAVAVIGGGVWFATKGAAPTSTTGSTDNQDQHVDSGNATKTDNKQDNPPPDPKAAIKAKLDKALHETNPKTEISALQQILSEDPTMTDASNALKSLADNLVNKGSQEYNEWYQGGQKDDGLVKTAIDDYKTAISADSKNFKAHYSLAGIYFIRNDHKNALAEVNKAEDLKPTKPEDLKSLNGLKEAILKGGN